MTMRQSKELFEANGYDVKKLACWMTAKNNDTIVHLWFAPRGQRGRKLTTAFVTEYPIFDLKRKILQTGIRAREFSKAKRISELLSGVRVCPTGVACADFMDGKLVKK